MIGRQDDSVDDIWCDFEGRSKILLEQEGNKTNEHLWQEQRKGLNLETWSFSSQISLELWMKEDRADHCAPLSGDCYSW